MLKVRPEKRSVLEVDAMEVRVLEVDAQAGTASSAEEIFPNFESILVDSPGIVVVGMFRAAVEQREHPPVAAEVGRAAGWISGEATHEPLAEVLDGPVQVEGLLGLLVASRRVVVWVLARLGRPALFVRMPRRSPGL